jgi:hypothetical protein
VPGDKVIYKYGNGCLEGQIINKSNNLQQIRCIKDRQEFDLSSFAKFIKLAIAPCDITSKNWKNLWIELYESKERLIWRDFRHRVLNESNGMVKFYTFPFSILTLIMYGI